MQSGGRLQLTNHGQDIVRRTSKVAYRHRHYSDRSQNHGGRGTYKVTRRSASPPKTAEWLVVIVCCWCRSGSVIVGCKTDGLVVIVIVVNGDRRRACSQKRGGLHAAVIGGTSLWRAYIRVLGFWSPFVNKREL